MQDLSVESRDRRMNRQKSSKKFSLFFFFTFLTFIFITQFRRLMNLFLFYYTKLRWIMSVTGPRRRLCCYSMSMVYIFKHFLLSNLLAVSTFLFYDICEEKKLNLMDVSMWSWCWSSICLAKVAGCEKSLETFFDEPEPAIMYHSLHSSQLLMLFASMNIEYTNQKLQYSEWVSEWVQSTRGDEREVKKKKKNSQHTKFISVDHQTQYYINLNGDKLVLMTICFNFIDELSLGACEIWNHVVDVDALP